MCTHLLLQTARVFLSIGNFNSKFWGVCLSISGCFQHRMMMAVSSSHAEEQLRKSEWVQILVIFWLSSSLSFPVPCCIVFAFPPKFWLYFPPKSPEVFLIGGEEQVHPSLSGCSRDLHPWWGEKGLLILGVMRVLSGFAEFVNSGYDVIFPCWNFLWTAPTTSSAGIWPCTHPGALNCLTCHRGWVWPPQMSLRDSFPLSFLHARLFVSPCLGHSGKNAGERALTHPKRLLAIGLALGTPLFPCKGIWGGGKPIPSYVNKWAELNFLNGVINKELSLEKSLKTLFLLRFFFNVGSFSNFYRDVRVNSLRSYSIL